MSEQENTQENMDIQLADIADAAKIIDVAVKRGTFSASEVEGVGRLFNKLSGFLEAVRASQESEETDETAAAEGSE